MSVDAYVLQETRAIYEWMIEPLLSVTACPMEPAMPPDFTRARRRLALRIARMNRSLRALAASSACAPASSRREPTSNGAA